MKLITASMDGNCRIFDLKTLNILRSLNFRENEKSDNLTMRSLLYIIPYLDMFQIAAISILYKLLFGEVILISLFGILETTLILL